MHSATSDGRLFLDVRGKPGAPPLLYLHGGPGMGCYEFMQWQGDRLSQRLHVIGLDQRGTLRSAPLADGETLAESDVIADCEALRESMGIQRWAVLGHSFGGRMALRYAHRHPERISAVLFENPGWDLAEADRAKLLAAAPLFAELGDPVSATRCRNLAAAPRFERWEVVDLLAGLGERHLELYVHRPEARSQLAATLANAFPAELRDRGDAAARRLLAAPDVLASMVGLLPGLAVPALLMKGRYDLVTGPSQLAAFRAEVPGGRVELFPRSAHYPQLEEPELYQATVQAFVTAHAR
ncbi:alpha/beta fold hydrolase [Actinocatenispora comari]|uniref:Proline iminopeptidase n=1 Tax=Actinocatenispora comari TaxID=2807577 RepID=A0A8J4AEC3_9ACTN|nr:alpha/beta hydrolase [Actinocatenispora comari]GIL29746.1 proline iminopeptidase [Actinocatenispora comari]